MGTDNASSLTVEKLRELPFKMTCEQQGELLTREFTDAEIKEVFLSMDPNKSPRIDGWNAQIFREFWGVVRTEVTKAIKFVLREAHIRGGLNSTHLCLIPNIPNPAKVGDFCHISCCNLFYKGIVKLLSNRLKLVINHTVSYNQNAFILGRNIQDNLLLAHELVRGYTRKNKSGRCAIKIDIKGAYDNVNWQGLMLLLERIDMPQKDEGMCMDVYFFRKILNSDKWRSLWIF